MFSVIDVAERIVYRAKLRYLEEVALASLEHVEGLEMAPLWPQSEAVQVVAYDGKPLGRIRREKGKWYGSTTSGTPVLGCYPDSVNAAESLYVEWLSQRPTR